MGELIFVSIGAVSMAIVICVLALIVAMIVFLIRFVSPNIRQYIRMRRIRREINARSRFRGVSQ